MLLLHGSFRLAAFCLSLALAAILDSARSFAPAATSCRSQHTTSLSAVTTSRRSLFRNAALGITGGSILTLLVPPSIAVSADVVTAQEQNNEQGQQRPGLVSRDRVAELLRIVPTFTIVDGRGVPFMVVGEDAKVTGYFFTTYDEAARILQLATVSADRAIAEAKRDGSFNDETMTNPWKLARISTVPLDTAVALALRSGTDKIRNHFQVEPSQADVEDALQVTGKDELAEGKVPLFYYKDFVMADGSSPLYFQKSQLEAAFRKANPGRESQQQQLPETLVTELFAVLTEMVRPGGTDQDLKSIVLVAPAASDRRAQECVKKGGKDAPFLLGQRNLVL